MGVGLSGFESPLRHHLFLMGVILRGYAFCFGFLPYSGTARKGKAVSYKLVKT